MPRSTRLERGDRRRRRRGQRGEARRRLEDRVAVRHPAASARAAGRPAAGPCSRTVSSRAAELADLGALDLAAERQREQLHAVTDAQHRDAELEQLRVELRRAVGVHRRRAAGEDQPLRLAPRGPPRRRRGGAAARRTRRTRARGARSAASTARRSRGRRPRRPRVGRLDVERRLVDELRGGRRRGDHAVGHQREQRRRLVRRRRRRSGACAAAAAPREPMPTPCAAWSCLPSVCSAGAIISSARLNSAMSLVAAGGHRGPQRAHQVERAVVLAGGPDEDLLERAVLHRLRRARRAAATGGTSPCPSGSRGRAPRRRGPAASRSSRRRRRRRSPWRRRRRCACRRRR